jgi:hypothetical protein
VSSVLVVEPDEARRRTVYRVPDVVDAPAVAVTPCVGNSQRPRVVTEEVSAKLATRFVLERNSGDVLDHQQAQGVRDGPFPGRGSRCEIARVLTSIRILRV